MTWKCPKCGRVFSRKHLGIYPGGEATSVFETELSEYSVSKGTIRIPYDRPLPGELI